nr:hypothetical protein [Paracoccus mutanolyticus]
MTGAADRTGAPGPVQLGVVMLCHNEMPTATRMARVWAEGGARVGSMSMPMSRAMPSRR